MENRLKEIWEINDFLKAQNLKKFVLAPIEFQHKSKVRQLAVKEQKDGKDDLYLSMSSIMNLCKIIGVVPLISPTSAGKKQNFWKFFRIGLNIIIAGILFTNAMISVWNLFHNYTNKVGRNANDFALAAKHPLHFIMGFILYSLLILKSKKFLTLFEQWRSTSAELILSETDQHFKKYVWHVSSYIFISYLIQIVLQHAAYLPLFQNSEHKIGNGTGHSHSLPYETVLEEYYFTATNVWAQIVPYNIVLTLFIFISNHLILIIRNLVDLLLVVLSRALAYKFQALNNQTIKLSSGEGEEKFGFAFWLRRQNPGIEVWTQIRKEHLILCKLIDIFEQFLSTILFVSFTTNIFFICMQLNEGLTPASSDENIIHKLWTAWSFLHFVSRILLVTWSGSTVNTNAHRIIEFVQKCASDDYNPEVERLESMLANTSIGLSGMSFFVLTREFFLVIVSICFTFEIVLIQATSVSQAVV